MTKTAVVLFNLGGPDSQEAVAPFLFNLFSDPAIISAPMPIRHMLAKYISGKRAPVAQKIYQEIGGKSPILQETQAQAVALEEKLCLTQEARVFICMRYWHPMTQQAVSEVAEYAPDRIILLPLYPQYSSSTTASSFLAWEKEAQAQGVAIPTARICCYPSQKHFISAHVRLIQKKYFEMASVASPRILFSAHGLPEKTIRRGDPYQWQVEQTAQSVVSLLGISGLDYTVCYQSRVGPMKWIGPSTEAEIRRAGAEKKPLMVVPIAFVSEHSETLVELDIEYKHLAEKYGVPSYYRVPSLGVLEEFIDALADLCTHTAQTGAICSYQTTRICSAEFRQCPCT